MKVIANKRKRFLKNRLYGFIPKVIPIINIAMTILNKVITMPRFSMKISKDDIPPHSAPITIFHLLVYDLVIFRTPRRIK